MRPISGLALALLFAMLTLASTAGVALAGEGDGDKPPPKAPPGECVKVRSEAPYSGYGYDHLVHLHNGCDAARQCEVSSNVNTTPQSVRVDKGASATVVTFRGSPSRAFEPKVDCKAAD